MPQKEVIGEINWPPANAQEIARFSSTEDLDKARADEAARLVGEAVDALTETVIAIDDSALDGLEMVLSGKDA